MNSKMLTLLISWLMFKETAFSQPRFRFVSTAVFNQTSNVTGCPPNSATEMSIAMLRDEVEMVLQSSFPDSADNEWREVISFDMANSSHSCPSPWTMVTSPARSCISSFCSSNSVVLNATVTYTQIQGELAGLATETPDAFFQSASNPTIEMGYLDGISITRGHPRQHIWSLAAGHGGNFRCPCDNPTNTDHARRPPAFVGENYFCDGSYNGELWDGQDCTTACCTFHSPPWFNVTLPVPTSDLIEVRNCADQLGGDERIYVRKMTIMVK